MSCTSHFNGKYMSTEWCDYVSHIHVKRFTSWNFLSKAGCPWNLRKRLIAFYSPKKVILNGLAIFPPSRQQYMKFLQRRRTFQTISCRRTFLIIFEWNNSKFVYICFVDCVEELDDRQRHLYHKCRHELFWYHSANNGHCACLALITDAGDNE